MSFDGGDFRNQVQQQLALDYAQEFFQCITKPGSSISSSEANCIARCADRYVDATQVIAQAIVSQGGQR
eukprot:jgi/Chlat1/3047/Chrsp208S00796